MNIIDKNCPCKLFDGMGNETECTNKKADVLAVTGDKILYRCTNGNSKGQLVFAHQYTAKPEDNEEWKKFFGEDITDKINTFKKLRKESEKNSK